MIPNNQFITIQTNQQLIELFISELIINPRIDIQKWATLTKQSSALKIGYIAQYLASLITGVKGSKSAARGDDLEDGTEIKGCNRIDQLDTCGTCGGKVSRYEIICNQCGGVNIIRKDDSKWLIPVRSEEELDLCINKIDRFIFIIMEYPQFEQNNFDKIRIRAFEIWPKYSANFRYLLEDYYFNIYLEHIRKNPSKTPAPKNFWPYSFQFYKCKPRKIYECVIDNWNSSRPIIHTTHFVSPHADRSLVSPESMPNNILQKNERDIIVENYKIIPDAIPSDWLDYIPMRESKPISHDKKYKRR